jgi:hypothetical protein
MLTLHNQERAKRDLPRFCVHPALVRAARAHSKDMIQRDYFSHNTKGRNEDACERVRRYGYIWQFCAENIAWGSGAPRHAGPDIRRLDEQLGPQVEHPEQEVPGDRNRHLPGYLPAL